MEKTNGKFKNFLKKNAVYLVLLFCVLAIGLSLALTLADNTGSGELNLGSNDVQTDLETELPSDSPVDTPVEVPDAPVSNVITFIMPVQNATEIGEYSETMVFNSLLGRFSTHMAIDFYAPEGTDVLAVYGGKIESIENTLLQGTTVVVDHGNGLKTVYNSITETDHLTVGKTVNQGDVIGKVSVTNRQEADMGAHLHFETIENGENIDPAKYLVFEEK